jgi:hypothetical protein
MRYRAQDANGDYTLGDNGANFLVNSPAAVGQAIMTRFALWTGQWFLDSTAGTPWRGQVLGYGTQGLYDLMFRAVITETPGVLTILSYSSVLNKVTRALSIIAKVATIYGTTIVTPVITTGGFGYNFGGDFGN